MIPLLVSKLPYLCTTEDINSNEIIQLIMDNVEFTKETTQWLVPLLIKSPEQSVCGLLFHVLEQNEKSQSSYELLGELMSHNSADIM